MAVQKQGGKSKKGRQHVAHEQKYRRQRVRTSKNKRNALELHLKLNPDDEQNKVDIKEALKKHQQ